MSDTGTLPLGLAQQKAAKPVDPEYLAYLGKRAAALHTEHGVDLTSAVVESVKDATLSPEQVKRVCEFANTEAFLSEFEKGGELRNITFEGGPANPAKVLQELNSGAHPAVHQVKKADYSPPPVSSYKEAALDVDEDEVLSSAFGSKKATAVNHNYHADPKEDVCDLYIRLTDMRDDLLSKEASSQVLLDTVKEDLYQAVRQELLDGTPMTDVTKAWAAYADNAELLKEAESMVCKRLQTDGIMSRESLVCPMRKVASAGSIPNPAHPVVARFIAFCKVASNHAALRRALNAISKELTRVSQNLRKHHGFR